MRIYTKTGDAGETALFDGVRVSKADARIEANGAIDELGSWLGVIRSRTLGADFTEMLARIQRDLFALGSIVSDPRRRIAARVEKASLSDDDVARLEGWIDALEATLPPLRRFILAGGAEDAALLHLARAVCRRAERRIVALGADAHPIAVTYVNRLSDLLFVMARAANARCGAAEIEW